MMSNAQRQRLWRERHPGEHARRQREYRAKRKGTEVKVTETGKFKRMITLPPLEKEEVKPIPAKPRFIHGMPVSEVQWQRHLEKLDEAKKKGFEYDEYSQ